MIPAFPVFKKLSPDDRKQVSRFGQEVPYSDFNFLSLWSWDVQKNAALSLLNNNLVLQFRDYLSNEFFVSINGSDSIDLSIRDLLLHRKKNHLDPVLRLVPQSVVDSIEDPADLSITEDRDSFDYIYSTRSLAELDGGDYEDIRKEIHKVTKLGAAIQIEEVDLSKKSAEAKILGVFHDWIRENSKSDYEIRNEFLAITKMFDYPELSTICSKVLHVDGKPAAFTIDEIINEEFVLGHFAKSTRKVNGSFSFLLHSNAKEYFKQGISKMNLEQDLGIEGLRNNKLSYRPSGFLKKYTIEMKKGPS